MKKPFKEVFGAIVFVLILIGLGAMMIINPDLGGYEPHGRHYLIKKLIVIVWSRPAGIIAIILGALSLFGLFVSDKDSSKEQKQPETI